MIFKVQKVVSVSIRKEKGMSIPCDREGTFRCEVEAYGLKEMDSGAVAVSLQVKLLEWFGAMHQGEEPQWHDWAAYNMGAEGDVWIITGKDKGNKVNQSAAESLMKHAGWDGDFGSIVADQWQPTRFAITTRADTDKNGNVRPGVFKLAFVNDYNRTPGLLTKISPESASALSNRHGAALRAIAGNIKRNGAPPSSRPTPPPVAAGAMKPPPPNGQDDESIPF